MKRIGIVGFGFIGAGLFCAVRDENLEIAFVYNRSPTRLAEVPRALVLDDISDFSRHGADLIVECAHPGITIAHGADFLAQADYLPLSVTALADDAVLDRLRRAAERHNHRLLIPRGALVGTESLLAWRQMWKEVSITFRKHPRNIDFACSGWAAEKIEAETVVHDGPVRGIARLYPRNVNTMVTCALATVGLDRCRGRLIADPALDCAIAEVEAIGSDGSFLSTVKRQPAIGVSGTEMLASMLRSTLKAAGVRRTVDFV